ncbi:hypothetical protein ACVIJ6_002464 [Bradyrhizobium sp. USDA 4369]
MAFFVSRSLRLAFAVSAAVVAGGECAISGVVASPTAASNAMLGPDWECWRLIWLTSCTHVIRSHPSSGSRRPAVAEIGTTAAADRVGVRSARRQDSLVR